MREEGRLPRWLEVADPLIVALQRRGMVIGTVRLLSIPGRKSGKLRTTPASMRLIGSRMRGPRGGGFWRAVASRSG